jgi:hypothetical protein
MFTVRDHRPPPTSAGLDRVVRVLVTFPWRGSGLAELGIRLGPAFELLNVHSASPADVVVCPPCREATLARLGAEHPGAAIVVVEPERCDLPAGLDRPVGRLLANGAMCYRVDGSPAAVASAVRRLGGSSSAAPPRGRLVG